VRTRIKALVAAVIATAAIGGALAAPASAVFHLVHVDASCLDGGQLFTFSTTSTTKVIHADLRELRHGCDKGTLEYTITKVEL
jgi:hypothetical protein